MEDVLTRYYLFNKLIYNINIDNIFELHPDYKEKSMNYYDIKFHWTV